MQIRKPGDIIRQLLANRGIDGNLAEQIIDALEAHHWRFVWNAK